MSEASTPDALGTAQIGVTGLADGVQYRQELRAARLHRRVAQPVDRED